MNKQDRRDFFRKAALAASALAIPGVAAASIPSEADHVRNHARNHLKKQLELKDNYIELLIENRFVQMERLLDLAGDLDKKDEKIKKLHNAVCELALKEGQHGQEQMDLLDDIESLLDTSEHTSEQTQKGTCLRLVDLRDYIFHKYMIGVKKYVDDPCVLGGCGKDCYDMSYIEADMDVQTWGADNYRRDLMAKYGLIVWSNFNNDNVEYSELSWENICPEFENVNLEKYKDWWKKGS